ncbi:MAG: hypothetical protein WDW38_002707 [Sanguina aurantia]
MKSSSKVLALLRSTSSTASVFKPAAECSARMPDHIAGLASSAAPSSALPSILTQQQLALPSFMASPTSSHMLAAMRRHQQASGLAPLLGVPASSRAMAGAAGPPPPGNSTDNWAAMRESYNFASPNGLGSAYYAMILVFGFAWYVQDMYALPPRVIAMMMAVYFLTYTRKSGYKPYA